MSPPLDRRALLAAAPWVLGTGALAGCVPLVQAPLPTLGGFTGPRLEPDALVAHDGARLGLTTWAAEREPWAVIVGVHGMNDYAEAFTLAAPIWAREGATTYAYDQRGFGRSPQRGVWGGAELMTEDLRTAVALARARHPNAVIAVVGESMGGSVAIAAFASDRPPDADRLVLSAPGVWGWDAQPFLYKSSLWLGAHTVGGRTVTAPRFVLRRIRATDNVAHLRRMSRDPKLLFRTRIDAIYGLVSLMQRARVGVGAIRRPPSVFYAYGRNDQIIPPEPTFLAARQLRPGDRSAYYARGFHMLTRDLQGPVVTRDMLSFIRDPAAPLPSGAPPIPGAPGARRGVSPRAARVVPPGVPA